MLHKIRVSPANVRPAFQQHNEQCIKIFYAESYLTK